MSISFIAKPVFFKPGENGGVYPILISSRVRGEEIAKYLGAEYTENTNANSEIRIHLKPRSIDYISDGDYIDLLDRDFILPDLKKRPKIKVIAMSKVQYDFLKKELKNELFYIPHHHINFENKKRNKKSQKLTGGFIGKPNPISNSHFDQINSQLSKIGVEFKKFFHWKTRQEMIDFYDQIDFQVIWFEDRGEKKAESVYRHPTKILNAASFGIPTIAQKLLGYQEFEGFYLTIKTLQDVATEAEKLKDKRFYNELSEKLIEMSKEYHISEIAKLYQQLK